MPDDETGEAGVIVETLEMADWLRRGPRGVEELLIAYGTDDPCVLAKRLAKRGADKSPIFRDLLEACRAARRGKLQEWLARGRHR